VTQLKAGQQHGFDMLRNYEIAIFTGRAGLRKKAAFNSDL
jgi:hypothetical protein